MERDHVEARVDNNERPAGRSDWRPLALALAIITTFFVVELAGGLLTNSLALLADAGHMLTDVGAIALALGAMWLARRPATPRRSFGYLRSEILAALANAVLLIVISIFIVWEAVRRLGSPPAVDSGPMLAVAVAGLVANAAAAWVLMRGGGHEEQLNTRGAWLHVLGDLLGSVGAILAGVIMLTTGWFYADPILSAGISLLILVGAARLLRESVDVLLEATPQGIDSDAVRGAMLHVPGVEDVHDLHIWTVTSGLVALSAHVEIAPGRDWQPILDVLWQTLAERFGITHVTLQPEARERQPDRFRGCTLDTPEGLTACRQIVSAVNKETAGRERGDLRAN